MSGLVILVAAAAVGFALAHWLRMPVIPLLIVPGFLLSHGGLGLELDSGILNELMGLGLTFLVLVAGIDLNPRRFRGKFKVVLWIATAQFCTLAMGGFVLALAFGFATLPAMYLGAALATSSTFVVVRQLNRRVGSLRAYGRLAIGALLVQDLVIIVPDDNARDALPLAVDLLIDEDDTFRKILRHVRGYTMGTPTLCYVLFQAVRHLVEAGIEGAIVESGDSTAARAAAN